MDAEMLEQRFVDSARQRPAVVNSPSRNGQPSQQAEENRPADQAQAMIRNQADAALEAEQQVVPDQGDFKFRVLYVHFLSPNQPTLINLVVCMLHVAKGLLVTGQLPWRCVPFVSIDMVLSAGVLHATLLGSLHIQD
jgi:hypothetical protein